MRIIIVSNGDCKKEVTEIYASKALQDFLVLYDGLFHRIYTEHDPEPKDGAPKHHIRYRRINIPVRDYDAWNLKRHIDKALSAHNTSIRKLLDYKDEQYFKETGYPVER